MYLTLYNICFTSLPILVYSLFEQLVHPQVLLNQPGLYRDISKNSLLSLRSFIYWTLLGFCHAFVFFFGSLVLLGEDRPLMGSGQMFGSWTFGTLVFTVMVVTVTLKLALETHFWTWMSHLVTWGSIAFYLIFSLFYGGIIWPFLHTQDMYSVFVQLLSCGSVWFSIFIITITCLTPDVLKKVLDRHLWPTATHQSQALPAPQGPTLSCVESFCCFQHGQSGCSRLIRLLDQMSGSCQTGDTRACPVSAHNRTWTDDTFTTDRSILTLSPLEVSHC